MKKGGSRPILTIPRTPGAAVTEYRFIGLNGSQITVAGTRALGVSTDAVSAEELAAVPPKTAPVTIIGTALIELGAGGCAAGTYGTSDASGKGITAVVAGHAKNCIFLEAGAAGDFVEAQVGDFGVV